MACSRLDEPSTSFRSSISPARADRADSIPGASAEAQKTASKRRNLAIQYFARSSSLRAAPKAEMELAIVARTVKAPQPIVMVKKIQSKGNGRQDSTTSTISEARSISPATSVTVQSLRVQLSDTSLSFRSRVDSGISAAEDMLSSSALGRRELQAMFAGAPVFSVERDQSGFIPCVGRFEEKRDAWATSFALYGYDSPQVSPSSQSTVDDLDPSEPGSLTFEQFLHKPLEEAPTTSKLNFARRRLLHTNPAKLGLRSVASEDLVHHLMDLGFFYQQLDARQAAAQCWGTSEIDQLGEELFATLLSLDIRMIPPEAKTVSLRSQIHVLQAVLSENHIWYDLSLPESQLKIGQALWADEHDEDDDADRTVLLLQLVLAAELFVRFRILESISAKRCEIVQSQQTDKINWDLVITERFLARLDLTTQASFGPTKHQRNRHSVLGMPTFLEAIDVKGRDGPNNPTVGRDFSEEQLDDIRTFAEEIGWPDREAGVASQEKFTATGWMGKTLMTCWDLPLETLMILLMGTLLENSVEGRDLLKIMPDWSTGFSFRGRSFWSNKCIVGRVMALGSGCRQSLSWISTPTHDSTRARWLDVECENVPGASKPRISQTHAVARDSHPTKCGSAELVTSDDFIFPTNGPKILGNEVGFEGLSFEPSRFMLRKMRLVGPDVKLDGPFIANLAFSSPASPRQAPIAIPLTYNVYFVSSHACRARRGSAVSTASQMTRSTDLPDSDRSLLSPPAHPLHKDFLYDVIPVVSLLNPDPQARLEFLQQPVVESDQRAPSFSKQATLVLDARGSANLSLLARAWCAETGSHALLSSTARTCLACSIREARALAIRVIIRT